MNAIVSLWFMVFVAFVVSNSATRVNGYEYAEPVHCSVTVKSYSAYDPCNKYIDGFVDLNGKRVWEAGWCCFCTGYKPHLRGISLIVVDPVSCSAVDSYTFDTWASTDVTADFVTYLQWLPSEAIVVGVTGDEPTRHLSSALRILKVAGVDVRDVQYRGNFAFILQKGYPKKTQMVKSVTNAVPFSMMTAVIQGTTLANLEIVAINKYDVK